MSPTFVHLILRCAVSSLKFSKSIFGETYIKIEFVTHYHGDDMNFWKGSSQVAHRHIAEIAGLTNYFITNI